jgi:hypothetical protein
VYYFIYIFPQSKAPRKNSLVFGARQDFIFPGKQEPLTFSEYIRNTGKKVA